VRVVGKTVKVKETTWSFEAGGLDRDVLALAFKTEPRHLPAPVGCQLVNEGIPLFVPAPMC